MICRLTPVKHAKLQDDKTIIPAGGLKSGFKGSLALIRLEPNQHASNGLAVAVRVAGRLLGYLPELASVTAWKGEHHEWTRAVEAIRNQLFLEHERNGTEEWTGHVAACRYMKTVVTKWSEPSVCYAMGETHIGDARPLKSKKEYCTYDELTGMKPEEQEGYRLEQVAISFPVEEL